MKKLWEFNNTNTPNIEEIKEVGNYLIESLSRFIGYNLTPFKEYIVNEEGSSISFFNKINDENLFSFQFEGVVSFSIKDKEPSISADILLFSNGQRIGLQRDSGDSYISLILDKEKGWYSQNWVGDGNGEWENLTEPRENLYSKLEQIVED